MSRAGDALKLGKRIAPPRFIAFIAVTLLAALAWHWLRPAGYRDSLVIGFDAGVLAFIALLLPLGRDHTADDLRRHARDNDANRGVILAITTVVTLAVLAAIVTELPAARTGHWHAIVKLVSTLALSWTFANLVFMLHYAHQHYWDENGGFEFPGTPEPDYWDFLYFAFTAGMSFAASDVNVTCGAVRRTLILHTLLSFVFNIGVLAFSINVLAGGAS